MRHMRLSRPVFTILSHLALLHDFPSLVLQLGGISAFQLSLMHLNLIFDLLIRLLYCLNLEQVFHPFNWLFRLAIQVSDPAGERLVRLEDLREVAAEDPLALPILQVGHDTMLSPFFAFPTTIMNSVETVIENIPTQRPSMLRSLSTRSHLPPLLRRLPHVIILLHLRSRWYIPLAHRMQILAALKLLFSRRCKLLKHLAWKAGRCRGSNYLLNSACTIVILQLMV